MRSLRFLSAVSILACLLLLPASSVAQTTAATIVGDISDPSGAAIPGVTIRITSEGTGAERVVESNEVGQYRVTALNPGTYMVQVENPGFKTQIRSGVVVQVADVLEVDFTLELGEVTETIEVTGAAPIMQTQEASCSRRDIVDCAGFRAGRGGRPPARTGALHTLGRGRGGRARSLQ